MCWRMNAAARAFSPGASCSWASTSMSHTFSNVGSGTDSAQNSYFLPDYCEFGATESNSAKEGGQESSEHTTVNVFIGPAGTVSPLHTDPRHNLFCQLRGRKFVRLIDADQRDRLYLFDDMLRRNSSQVDAEHPDLTQFPRFADVRCQDAVVGPGECLFIPRGCFHHVRAMDRSISVSIWFGPPAAGGAGEPPPG